MPKFVEGDEIYVGSVAVSQAETKPTGDVDLGGSKKIVSIEFGSPIFNAGKASSELKAKVEVATDGENFSALGASDTVEIEGSYLVVTFDSALSTSTNKIKIGADAVQNVFGVTNAEVTTEAIDAS